MKQRTPVFKTYKLFINGQFPRTESGHYFQLFHPKTKKPIANICRGSRKDLRDAVVAARNAFPKWMTKTATNRGQILYRMAEVLESRKMEFIEEMILMTNVSKQKATAEVLTAIDRLVWYAGWSDKFQQVFGTVNPVALPYFNFTLPEPMGVVGLITPNTSPLLPLVSMLAPAMIAGDTTVVCASEKYPLTAITFGEVLATSDVPAGVVNILTGFQKELVPHLAKHMDVNAIFYGGSDLKTLQQLQEEASTHVKRIIHRGELEESPYWIQSLTEMKTTWHPIGV